MCSHEMWEEREPDDVCQCGAFHDDLEHGENLCGACGLPIFDVFGPTDVVYPMTLQSAESGKGEK